MALFTPNSNVALPVPSDSVRLTVIRNNISQQGLQTYNQLKSSWLQGIAQFWNNKQYSPDKIITGFGTDAAHLFTVSAATEALLSLIDSTFVPPITAVSNSDGSINFTITGTNAGVWKITFASDGSATAVKQ